MSYAWSELFIKKGKEGFFDIFTWLSIGNVFTKYGLSEYGYHCYYIAHLKDPENIPANSLLNLETLSNANLSDISKNSVDEIMKSLL